MVSSDIDWKALEKEVNEEINKNISIKFDDKTINETKYIQKYAEARLIDLGGELNLIILVTAVAMSLGIPYLYKQGLEEAITYIIAIILLFEGGNLAFKYRRQYRRCHKIILDAEKRILSEGIAEPNMPQETTSITSPIQEKCYLSIDNWVNIINSEIESHEYPDFVKIINPILVFLIALIGFMISSVNTQLAPVFVLIWRPIYYTFGIGILIAFYIFLTDYRKIDKELKKLKKIREDIISGKLKDTNEIYGEWNEIHR